jgi:hypothetical protein
MTTTIPISAKTGVAAEYRHRLTFLLGMRGGGTPSAIIEEGYDNHFREIATLPLQPLSKSPQYNIQYKEIALAKTPASLDGWTNSFDQPVVSVYFTDQTARTWIIDAEGGAHEVPAGGQSGAPRPVFLDPSNLAAPSQTAETDFETEIRATIAKWIARETEKVKERIHALIIEELEKDLSE